MSGSYSQASDTVGLGESLASAFLSTTWVILICRKQSRNVTLVTFCLEMEIEIPLLQMEKLRLTEGKGLSKAR